MQRHTLETSSDDESRRERSGRRLQYSSSVQRQPPLGHTTYMYYFALMSFRQQWHNSQRNHYRDYQQRPCTRLTIKSERTLHCFRLFRLFRHFCPFLSVTLEITWCLCFAFFYSRCSSELVFFKYAVFPSMGHSNGIEHIDRWWQDWEKLADGDILETAVIWDTT